MFGKFVPTLLMDNDLTTAKWNVCFLFDRRTDCWWHREIKMISEKLVLVDDQDQNKDQDRDLNQDQNQDQEGRGLTSPLHLSNKSKWWWLLVILPHQVNSLFHCFLKGKGYFGFHFLSITEVTDLHWRLDRSIWPIKITRPAIRKDRQSHRKESSICYTCRQYESRHDNQNNTMI